MLDLCDDPDIRDFIIQKTKEIENQHQQAVTLAAFQKQMQQQQIQNTNLISNHLQPQNLSSNSSTNGSIKKNHILDSSNSIINNNNNSTRSLKRTSTGVSRRSVFLFICFIAKTIFHLN